MRYALTNKQTNNNNNNKMHWAYGQSLNTQMEASYVNRSRKPSKKQTGWLQWFLSHKTKYRNSYIKSLKMQNYFCALHAEINCVAFWFISSLTIFKYVQITSDKNKEGRFSPNSND